MEGLAVEDSSTVRKWIFESISMSYRTSFFIYPCSNPIAMMSMRIWAYFISKDSPQSIELCIEGFKHCIRHQSYTFALTRASHSSFVKDERLVLRCFAHPCDILRSCKDCSPLWHGHRARCLCLIFGEVHLLDHHQGVLCTHSECPSTQKESRHFEPQEQGQSLEHFPSFCLQEMKQKNIECIKATLELTYLCLVAKVRFA